MKFNLFLLALLPAVAFALDNTFVREANDIPAIITDLNTVNNDSIDLNQTLNSFPDGGPISSNATVQFKSISTKVHTDLQKLINDVLSSPKFTIPQATRILNHTFVFKDTLITVGQNFDRHTIAFDSAGLAPSVNQTLKSYRNSIQQACTGLKRRSPGRRITGFKNVCIELLGILEYDIDHF